VGGPLLSRRLRVLLPVIDDLSPVRAVQRRRFSSHQLVRSRPFPGSFRAGLGTGLGGEEEGRAFAVLRAEGATWGVRAQDCES